MLGRKVLLNLTSKRLFSMNSKPTGMDHLPQWLKFEKNAIYVHVHTVPGSKGPAKLAKVGDKYVEISVEGEGNEVTQNAQINEEIRHLFTKFWSHDIKVDEDQVGHGKTVRLTKTGDIIQDKMVSDLERKIKEKDIL